MKSIRKMPMKNRFLSLGAMAALIALVFFASAGCSNPNVDTAKVRKVMQGITPEEVPRLEEALSDIDAGKYQEALMPLRRVAYAAKLNKAQTKMLEETIAKVRAKISKGQS